MAQISEPSFFLGTLSGVRLSKGLWGAQATFLTSSFAIPLLRDHPQAPGHLLLPTSALPLPGQCTKP